MCYKIEYTIVLRFVFFCVHLSVNVILNDTYSSDDSNENEWHSENEWHFTFHYVEWINAICNIPSFIDSLKAFQYVEVEGNNSDNNKNNDNE